MTNQIGLSSFSFSCFSTSKLILTAKNKKNKNIEKVPLIRPKCERSTTYTNKMAKEISIARKNHTTQIADDFIGLVNPKSIFEKLTKIQNGQNIVSSSTKAISNI